MLRYTTITSFDYQEESKTLKIHVICYRADLENTEKSSPPVPKGSGIKNFLGNFFSSISGKSDRMLGIVLEENINICKSQNFVLQG